MGLNEFVVGEGLNWVSAQDDAYLAATHSWLPRIASLMLNEAVVDELDTLPRSQTCPTNVGTGQYLDDNIQGAC